jgi:hydrogenase expression/formation protein HypE
MGNREERGRQADGREEQVLLGHGGGGLLTQELIEKVLLPHLDNRYLHPLDDAALLPAPDGALAFTTDTYVVSPLFFPGGDIGKLAICGTVNDLAVKGAEPLWLSMGLVIEEGFALDDLARVASSAGETARAAGVAVVTGDTKVVEKGRGDGLFVNTAGIGRVVMADPPGPRRIAAGDALIVTGFLGDHGIAILARRSGITFTPEIYSDCAPLWGVVKSVLDAGLPIHAMRDLTRGGLAAAVVQFAQATGLCLRIEERALPVRDSVRGACDLLGLDPLVVANEGNLLMVCPAGQAEQVVRVLQTTGHAAEARIVGDVRREPEGLAVLTSTIGGERIIAMPVGEDLPRIC